MPWKCPNCGHLNHDFRTNCVKCRTSKHGGGPPITTPKTTPSKPIPTPSTTPTSEKFPSDKIQCQNIGCRETYDRTERFCPRCGTPNPRAPALKSGQTACSNPACGKIYNITEPECPDCHTKNRAYVKLEKVEERVSKKISGRVYEILMFVIAGIVAWFVPPFFGLPPMQWLAFALIIFIPFYTILPSERDVLASLKMGTTIGREHITGGVGLLIVKAFIKLIIFGLVIFQFMIWPLVALIVTFIFYFSMPTHYKTSQIYKMLEAWFRMGVGGYLALLLFRTFGGTGGPLASWAFLLLGLAFFATFPEQSTEEDEGVTRIVISKKLDKAYSSLRMFDKWIWFLPLMLISLFTFMEGTTGFQAAAGGNITYAIFLAVWVLSFFSGLVAGPEGRPVLGILVIFIALFAFSSTYTGVMGQAIFGYWWPQVESFGSMIAETVGPMWSQATGGMSDAWSLLTNPAGYYQKQMEMQQVKKSVVKTGGTKQSIELSRFDLFSAVLDPSHEPLLGTIELENKGEFNANYINLEIQAFWKDPVSSEERPVGGLEKITCSGDTGDYDSGTGPPGYCKWSGTTYPTEIKFSTFKFTKVWTGTKSDGSPLDLAETVNDTYVYGGKMVKIKANYDYNYNVNVSIPIEVIPFSLYTDLLQARQITLQELTSEYSGGPVKATIYSQKQPVRNGEDSLIRVSLVNEGSGNVTSIIGFTVYVPDILEPQALESSTFETCTEGSVFTDSERSGFKKIFCTYSKFSYPKIGPNDYRTAMFLIKPTQITENRKTTSIIGIASYNYKTTKSKDIQVAAVPFGT